MVDKHGYQMPTQNLKSRVVDQDESSKGKRFFYGYACMYNVRAQTTQSRTLDLASLCQYMTDDRQTQRITLPPARVQVKQLWQYSLKLEMM